MDRKERIDGFIAKMEEQYKPSEKHKLQMKSFLYRLLEPNPNITEDMVDGFLQDAEKRYERVSKLDDIRKGAQDGISKIGDNLRTIAESYCKQMEGVAEILGHIGGVAEMTEEAEKTCRKMEEDSARAKENSEKVSKNLSKIDRHCKKIEGDLGTVILKKTPPQGNA